MASPSPDLIQDITTRFILTAPAEQLMFFESIMFLVEQAHWYYEDYVRDHDTSLRPLGLKEFAVMVFENCPELSQHSGNIEQIMEHFKAFKKNVPVMGGILLDQDMQRVLLVKGWKNSACWGFPRGKIHKNETDAQCAVREVLEETGFDIEDLVNEDDFIELTLDGKRNKLFIVAGLDPNSAQFAPKCKGEIGGYAWHKVADLPATREEGNQTFVSDDGMKHKFFMVWPYLKPLRKWIRKHQRNQPEGLWDMPQPVTTTPQQQQLPFELLCVSTGSRTPQSPLPQQVQQLAQGDRRTTTGSPKHTLHAQFHEAALAQARQTAAVTYGPNPANAIVAGPGVAAVDGVPPAASPLATLMGNAATRPAHLTSKSHSTNNLLPAGNPGPRNGFTFNRGQILQALANPPGAVAVPLRRTISGRG